MVEVKLHDVGEGMTEGEISEFLVQVGDQVKIDQPLVEVQTDKVSAELPSPVAGTVKEIRAEIGEVVTVGTTVLVLEKEGASVDNDEQPEGQPKEKSALGQTKVQMKISRHQPTKNTHRVLATPYTRRIALENRVDIEKITGTGPAGRVMDDDVYRFVKGEQEAPAASVAAEPVVEKDTASKESTLPQTPAKTIPYRGRRKQIGTKMTHSLQTIPHVTQFDEVDVTNVLALREELKAEQGESGSTVSVAAFFIKALAITLKDFPIFNAILNEEKQEIQLQDAYNIGLAADTDEGLIVPVVKSADQKSITEIHTEMKRVMKLAKENKLSKADLTGGTFTVSNVGPLGSVGATPIINHPEVALIAFHKTKKMPVVRNDEIVIRSVMNLSMSFDHRVADGAAAVAFTNRFAELIENPTKMMLEMV